MNDISLIALSVAITTAILLVVTEIRLNSLKREFLDIMEVLGIDIIETSIQSSHKLVIAEIRNLMEKMTEAIEESHKISK